MDIRYLTTGQMAKANRISEKALRLYQEKGLLEPMHVDPETGWRRYDVEQSTRLDMILQLQTIGFSLDEIAAIAENGSIPHLRQQAKRQVEHLKAQRREIDAALHLANCLIDSCAAYESMPILDQIMLERLPARRFVRFTVQDPVSLQAGNTESTSRQWEWELRRVRQQIVDGGLPIALYHDLACIIPAKSIEAGAPTKSFIIAWADGAEAFCEDPALLEGRIESLPEGEYMSLYLDQAYDENGQELDSDRIMRMRDYIAKKGMEVAGDAIGEGICRYPRFFGEKGKLLYRFCIPVRSKRG